MKKRVFVLIFISLILGFILGIYMKDFILVKKIEYFELQDDYYDAELGNIKKGTLLKYDESFSEGFTRYILFLNIHDSQAPSFKKENSNNVIIPYWIEKKE